MLRTPDPQSVFQGTLLRSTACNTAPNDRGKRGHGAVLKAGVWGQQGICRRCMLSLQKAFSFLHVVQVTTRKW